MQTKKTFTTLAFAALSLLTLTSFGCAGGQSEEDTGGYATSVPAGEDESATGSEHDGLSDSQDDTTQDDGTSEDNTSDGMTGYDPKFDLGTIPDAAPINPGCKKVDLVFVVDNSQSMEGAQTKLKNAFGVFAEQMVVTLTEVDSYHVMVTTTDDYINAECQLACFNSPDACLPWEPEVGADLCAEESPQESWGELGCGVVAPVGEGASLPWCLYDPKAPPANPTNYLSGGPDDLTQVFVDKFTCAAQVGIDGNINEQPLESVKRGLTFHNADGRCNEGFLRDDAILVVVMITDEEDKSGTLATVVGDQVVGTKTNKQDAVFLGFFPFNAQQGISYDCDPTDGIQGLNKRLLQFAGRFQLDRRSCVNVGAFSYGAFFTAFLEEVIKSSCDEFVAG